MIIALYKLTFTIPLPLPLLYNTISEYNKLKFDEWVKSSLLQQTYAVLVANVFGH